MRISDWSSDVCSSDLIAMLFGDDARRRDARVQRIAADDGARAIAPARQAVAVDQYLVRIAPQCLDRARHREEGRLQYVDRIDLGDARLTHAPAAMRLDLDVELGASLCGELLGIVEPVDPALAQDHRRGHKIGRA